MYECVEESGDVINSVSFTANESKETECLGSNDVIFAVGGEFR